MASERTFVIVGASLAGAKAAEALRSEGFDGRLVLVGEEEHRPYERPGLSKEYLRGESDFESLAVHAASFYEENSIELIVGTEVLGLYPQASEVSLGDGTRLHYHALLLATGASPRRLQVSGGDLPGVFYLRRLEDADALREAIGHGGPVVVVGGGWIGTEVAASARQMGASVSLVEPQELPLLQALGHEVASIYTELHRSKGVDLYLGRGVREFRGAGRVEEVVLDDSTVLEAEVVVVGIGVVPRVELAQAGGIHCDNGVVTDECLRSSVPGIWAAGDVASSYHPLYGTHIRLEHWSAALNQGPWAAGSMLGRTTPYARVPYFFSDQYELGMECRGWLAGADQVVLRRRDGELQFLAFWLRSGRVVGALSANIWDQGPLLERIVSKQFELDPTKLGDPDVELASLVGEAESD
jgi:3-phenylpropionate/trans-cinnamate dioxygenase ferredoxin reductase subunit